MPWDPLGEWPNERRWIWATVAAWVCFFQGPIFINNLQAPDDWVPDFFQEYASARNYFEGLPIYTDQRVTMERYGAAPTAPDKLVVLVNAHPPTSVLLAIPFARLDFDTAFLLWNLASLAALAVSLWIVLHQLRIPFSSWSMFPLVTLLLLCHPFLEQLRHGQLNLVLLLLLTTTWAAERSGRPWLAGTLLGWATAIKLFPGFLLLYYAWRRQWQVVAAGLIALAALTGLTAAVLGIKTYRAYIQDVLPEVQWFRVGWSNASLTGYWSRLLDPAPGKDLHLWRAEPLWYSPVLAWAASWLSATAVVAVLAWAVRRARTRSDDGLAFGLAVTAMLLVSPITWEHYFVLLLVPLAVIWLRLPPSWQARGLFVAIVFALWLKPSWVWRTFHLEGRVATPLQSVGILSYQCYALLGLFALGVLEVIRGEGQHATTTAERRRWTALGAVALFAMWAHAIASIWQSRGLFDWMGLDYAIFRSIAMGLVSGEPASMYDLDSITAHIRPLTAYYGPRADPLKVGPGPYPAVYILPFVPLTMLPPVVGFLVWVLANLALAISVARGLASRFEDQSWGLVATAVLFFPVTYALLLGQVTIILLFGLYRAYRAFEEGRDFRAGLWTGLLLLKPQYVFFLAIVLLFTLRWRTLAGMTAAGLVILLSSVAIVGPAGLQAYLATVRSMAGFREVHPIIFPDQMINWRGLLVNFLPPGASESLGLQLTLALSVITAGTLPVIWRRGWGDPTGEHFAARFLATMIVTMLVSFHNHIHGAALLLVPGMALAARGGGPRPLPSLFLASLYVPLAVFSLTGSTRLVAWTFLALMLATLVVLLAAELSPRSPQGGPTSDGAASPSPA